MNKIIAIFGLVLMLSAILPINQVYAQTFDDDTISFSQTDTSKVLVKAKKNKDKVDVDSKFAGSLIIDLITIAFILLVVYYPKKRDLENIFTFVMFNISIFLLTFVFHKIKISIGAAFGLFAVFSMLRYRTEGITMKDMTYLLIVIAVGLISSIQLDYSELIIINGIIAFFTFVFDSNILFKQLKPT